MHILAAASLHLAVLQDNTSKEGTWEPFKVPFLPQQWALPLQYSMSRAFMPGKMKLFFSMGRKIEYGGFPSLRTESTKESHTNTPGCRLSISCPPSLPWVAEETQALTRLLYFHNYYKEHEAQYLQRSVCIHALTRVHNFNRCYCSSSVSIQV